MFFSCRCRNFCLTIGELNYRYETGVGDSFWGGNKWVVYYFLNTLTDFHCYFDYGICWTKSREKKKSRELKVASNQKQNCRGN